MEVSSKSRDPSLQGIFAVFMESIVIVIFAVKISGFFFFFFFFFLGV
jgi:hypothetical protein